MGNKKIDKFRKDSRKEATPQPAPSALPKIVGCPIPDPIQCTLGKPVSNPQEGVLMECTNVACPYKGQPVHEQCFAEYEDHLIKKISTMGSARGWTDAQRRANIWEKKGQSLIAKNCRCRCGLGATKRDEMAHYNKVLREQAAARVAEANRRKHPKNNKHLPQLNFPLARGPPQKETKDMRRLARHDSVSSETSLDEPFAYRREPTLSEYRTNSITSAVPTLADFEDTMSTSSRNDVFYDSIPADLVPAPQPPPITRSYAAATSSKSDQNLLLEMSPTSKDGELTLIFNNRDDSGLESKGESPLLSSFAGSKRGSSSSISEHSDDGLNMTPVRPPVIARSQLNLIRDYSQSTGLTLQEPTVGVKEEPKMLKVAVVPDFEHEADTELEDEELPGIPLEFVADWCPITGRGFDLGETILANFYFPGLVPKGSITY